MLWQIECRTIAADGRSHIEDRTLNKANYNALEGVRGALQKRVNEIYNNLKQDEKLATKQIFAKLVNIVDTESGSKTVSRRANRSEFVGELVQNTLQTFIDENLLVSSSENLSAEKLQISDSKNSTQSAIIEIAHEILLSSWDRLKSWVEQEKEAIILKNWLAGETGRWQKIRSEDESKAREELLKGSRLEQVVDLREKDAFQNIGGLRAEENEFIDASVAEKDRTEREKREKEEQRQRELEAVQKLAKESEARAEQERKAQIATLSEKAATTRNFLSLNLEPLKGLVMAIEAIGTSQSLFNNILAQVESTLIEAINVSRQRNLIEVDQAVYSIAISADGQTLVSGGSDKKVRLWDKEGNLIREFQEHEEAVNSVAISADGHTIVSGSDDETVRLWDRKDDSIRILGTHRRSVKSVDISPDGQRILSGGLDAAAHLWTRDGKLLHIFQDSDWVLSVAISSDGQTVAIGGKEGSVKLLDRYGKPIGQPFIGHEGYERRGVNSVDISPDEQTIISGSYDGTIRFWDVSISKTFGKHQYEAKVAISSDGKTIVSADGNHSTGSNRDMESTIRLWDKESNLMEKPIKIFEASRFTSVTISPDGQTIFSGNGDGTLRLWNRNGRLLKQPSIKHKGAVQSVAFSPDGQYIVTGGSDNTVRLWDKEGNFIREFQGHQNTVYSVAFSLDGQYIVSGGGGGADNTVRLWDKEGNAIGQPFTGSEDAFTSVAFSPDGQTIVSSSAEGKIWLWNQQGKLIKSFRGHKNAVSSVAFSPDGQYIVSGGFDQAVRLWDREGNSLGQFRAQSRVFSLAFSPDGQYIVTSGSKTVQLWPFGWKSWLQVGCDRLRNNPVLVKPETEEAQAARQTCEKYAWSE